MEKNLISKFQYLFAGYKTSMLAKNRKPHLIAPSGSTVDGIFKLLRSPAIDTKKSIPQAYVAWRNGSLQFTQARKKSFKICREIAVLDARVRKSLSRENICKFMHIEHIALSVKNSFVYFV
jgi:hypothetical protein